jgi:hypothetical protein
VPFVEGQATAVFSKAWFRVSMNVGGTGVMFSWWMQGFFTLRER